MPVPTKRLTDAARDVLAVVDKFGAGWEGGTMRDTRSEKLGREDDVVPPSTGFKMGAGIVVVGIAVLLLVAWRG